MRLESAIVLAAGEGKRLRPLTRYRPKPMLPAATTPILERVFDTLIDAGITEITVVVGYGRERVQSHFGPTHRSVPLTYVTQSKQLGSGHALLQAADAVDGGSLVVNGDQVVDEGIVRDVRDAHDEVTAATLGLLQRPDVASYGGVIRDGDEVTEIVEHPSDDRHYYLNAGVYAIEPVVFEGIRAAEPRDGEHSLVDGLTELIDSGRTVRGVVSDGLWVDATYPWDLLGIADELFAEAAQTTTVAASATVHDTATLRDPVVVAADCTIGPGAVVGPGVCLGANTTVGSNAVVEHSVIDADTRIGAQATVIDCVTGTGVTIGPGTTIPGGPGDVRVGDRIHEAETLGALLADRVTDHGACTYVPGAIVGPAATIATSATVRGTLAEGTEVRS